MSRRNKILRRFLIKPADFTFKEMVSRLKGFGYKEMRTGATAGSRLAFINRASGHMVRLHKPHPGKVLKRYQLDFLEEELRAKGLLK
jgi:hypothetical protein